MNHWNLIFFVSGHVKNVNYNEVEKERKFYFIKTEIHKSSSISNIKFVVQQM